MKMLALFLLAAFQAAAQPVERVLSLAQKERPALLETLKELTAIGSGSREPEELDRIATTLATKLRVLGARAEVIEPVEADTHRMSDTPEKIGKMVRATFSGTGTRKILLLAHMDTVYPRGMLERQPFRIDGDRAYGLGIIDDRHGIGLILHAIAMLNALDFRDYGTITVFFNGDEEIGAPASRKHLTRLGAEHDAVISIDTGGGYLALASVGVGQAVLTARGRARHASGRGENALEELAFQIGQMRDLSDADAGIKVAWTLARAGVVVNMIPPEAQATADVRVRRVADYETVERRMRERMKTQLFADSRLELLFEPRYPPMQRKPASEALARHVQALADRELGMKIEIPERPLGGGTNAGAASLETSAPVLEGFGLRGDGMHSANAEYVLISSIEPALYLLVRALMDIAQGKGPLGAGAR